MHNEAFLILLKGILTAFQLGNSVACTSDCRGLASLFMLMKIMSSPII